MEETVLETTVGRTSQHIRRPDGLTTSIRTTKKRKKEKRSGDLVSRTTLRLRGLMGAVMIDIAPSRTSQDIAGMIARKTKRICLRGPATAKIGSKGAIEAKDQSGVGVVLADIGMEEARDPG